MPRLILEHREDDREPLITTLCYRLSHGRLLEDDESQLLAISVGVIFARLLP